jgi:hypothetical protein
VRRAGIKARHPWHSATTMTGSYTHSSPQAMEMAMELAMELVADYSREKIFSLTAKSRQALRRPATRSFNGGCKCLCGVKRSW